MESIPAIDVPWVIFGGRPGPRQDARMMTQLTVDHELNTATLAVVAGCFHSLGPGVEPPRADLHQRTFSRSW